MSGNKRVQDLPRFFMVTLALVISMVISMTLSVPVFAQGYGRFVSNTPIPAGPNASIEEVWLRHGGARLQFDALMGPIQVNTNGRPWRDPVMVDYLPPLYPKKRPARPPAPTVKAVEKCPPASAEKKTANPSPVLTPAISRVPPPLVPAEKLAPAQATLQEEEEGSVSTNGLGNSPYSGPASPSPEAPPLKEMGQNGSLSDNPESKVYQDPFHYH